MSDLISRPALTVVPPRPDPAPPSDAELERVLDGVVGYLEASFEPEPGRLWPVTAKGRDTDPLNVMHGAAGIGLLLCQLVERRPSPGARQLLDRAVERTVDAIAQDRNRPAGLYSGMAGTAWFLADAGRALGENDLIDEAARLLRSLPAELPVPDLFGGTAGLLLAAAKLARLTGDPAMIERIDAAGRRLAAGLVTTPFGPGWVLPKSHTPDRLDKVYPGYAHGTSGIAYALLCGARAGGDESLADIAIRALDGLVTAGWKADGHWFWPTSSASALGAPGWLKGAAGIGMGLARAFVMTGRVAYREAALGCIELIEPIPVSATLAQVNGLAGIGEFLLDADRLLVCADVRPTLDRVLSIVYEQRVERTADGFGVFFPDEEGLAGADFGTGSAGIAAFLLRAISVAPRFMTLDEARQVDSPAIAQPITGTRA